VILRLRGDPWRWGLAALLTVIAAFVIYAVDLMRTVAFERAEVEVRVGWMRSAELLHGRGDADGLATLRGEIAARPGAAPLADLIPGPGAPLAGFTAGVRRDLAGLSARLGERWEALNVVTLAALGFAALSLILFAASRRRQRALVAAQARLTATNDALQRANAAEQAAGEQKARFLAYVSHELRTPLQGILGVSAQLAEPGDDGREPDLRVTGLQTAAQDLLRMVDELLDFSRIDSGRLSIRLEAFDLRGLFEQVVEFVGPSAARKGLALHHELAADLPARVVGDTLRLRQVVLNLMANAVKFTDQGSVGLHVGVTPRGSSVRLRVEVRDTGPGIPRAAQARLFQPFTRVSEPGAARREGTGLGLVISRRIVEMLGGRLDVDSSPGVGSTFWFELDLPLAAAAATSTTAATAATPAERVADGSRVLVAEDDPTNRTLLQAVLTRAGHLVDVVEDGPAALVAARAHPYAIVLLDVELPGLAGPAVARELRKTDAGVAIVALTGHTDVAVHARCKAAGIDVVLTKPIEPAALREALARIVVDRGGPLDMSALQPYRSADDREFLTRLIDIYLEEAARVVAALTGPDADLDPPAVARLAHRLKGSSASMGARQLAICCQTLHDAARLGLPLGADVAGVLGELARVVDALRGEQARLPVAGA